jgi:hypothetical protein
MLHLKLLLQWLLLQRLQWWLLPLLLLQCWHCQRGRLWWQNLLLMWFCAGSSTPKASSLFSRFDSTSAAIVLQAGGLVLTLCSTYWTETFRCKHGQLQ